MLCDISEMFTHAFTKSSLGVTDVLFKTNNSSYAVYDVVGFAVAIPNRKECFFTSVKEFYQCTLTSMIQLN